MLHAQEQQLAQLHAELAIACSAPVAGNRSSAQERGMPAADAQAQRLAQLHAELAAACGAPVSGADAHERGALSADAQQQQLAELHAELAAACGTPLAPEAHASLPPPAVSAVGAAVCEGAEGACGAVAQVVNAWGLNPNPEPHPAMRLLADADAAGFGSPIDSPDISPRRRSRRRARAPEVHDDPAGDSVGTGSGGPVGGSERALDPDVDPVPEIQPAERLCSSGNGAAAACKALVSHVIEVSAVQCCVALHSKLYPSLQWDAQRSHADFVGQPQCYVGNLEAHAMPGTCSATYSGNDARRWTTDAPGGHTAPTAAIPTTLPNVFAAPISLYAAFMLNAHKAPVLGVLMK